MAQQREGGAVWGCHAGLQSVSAPPRVSFSLLFC